MATAMAAPAAATEEPFKTKMRNFAVQTINPRLVIYNRPLLLAVCIFATTALTTAGMFWYLVNSCVTTRDRQAFTQLGSTLEHKELLADVLEMAGVDENINTEIDICLIGARTLDTFAHPNVAPSIGGPGVVAYVPCGITDAKVSDMGLSWCGALKRQKAIDDCASAGGLCRPCGDHIGNGAQSVPVNELPYAILARTSTVRTVCPLAWTSFGIALGYAAYFEILLTLLLVLLLRSAGIITLPYGHVSELTQMQRLAGGASLGYQARAGCFHANRMMGAASVPV